MDESGARDHDPRYHLSPACPPMTARRMSSRKVALTAAFLALAAGGTAACDNPGDDVTGSTYEPDSNSYQAGPAPTTSSPSPSASSSPRTTAPRTTAPRTTAPVPAPPVQPVVTETAEEATTDEVFYCADEEGEILEEDYCADIDGTSPYFLWYSPNYSRGLTPGTYLDGGDYISAGDHEARRAFKLPATGKVGNGTIKTGIVGRGSGDSGSGSSGG